MFLVSKSRKVRSCIKRVSTLILLCHFGAVLFAQPMHTRIYGPKDGLPDLECRGVFDMDGHIYVASQSAMSKRVGKNWITIPTDTTGHDYSTSSAMSFDNGYYVMRKGREGVILYKNGIWREVPSPKCSQLTAVKVKQSWYCYCNDGNSYKFDFENAEYIHHDSINHSEMEGVEIISWHPSIDSLYIFYSYITKDGSKKSIVRNVESGDLYDRSIDLLYSQRSGTLIYNRSSNELSLNGESKGQMLTNTNIPSDRTNWQGFKITEPSEAVYNIFGLSESKWYLTVLDSAGLKLRGSIPHYLPSLSPFSNINANATLMATHLGLIRIDHNRLWFDSDNSEIVDAIHSITEDNDGVIWFGGYGGGIASYSNGIIKKNEEVPYRRYLPGAHKHNDNRVYTFLEGHTKMATYANGVWQNLVLIRDGSGTDEQSGYLIRSLHNGQMVLGLQKYGLGLVDSIENDRLYFHTIGPDKGMAIPNILGIAEDNQNRIWMGGRGVALYDPIIDTAYTYARSDTNHLSFASIAMAHDKWDNLWLGTNKGLYVLPHASEFDPKEDDFFGSAKQVPLPNGEKNWITSVMITSDNLLIAGGQDAVNLIPLQKFNLLNESPFVYQLYYGDDISGEGTEQNCIIEDSKGYVWIGTQTGALRIDPKTEIWDTSSNNIVIISQETGKGDIELVNDKLTLPSDSRNLSIEYGPDEDPFLRNSTFYDRFLMTQNGDTLESLQFDQDGHLELNYLEPGRYVLHIIAKKHNQVIDQRNINIYVPKTLTESAWFWAGLAFIISGIIGIFLFFRTRQKQQYLTQSLKLAKLENEKDKQQIQAIISSFNPHFINNSLHWAQSRYNRDEPFVRVIGRLSANIRHLFTYTTKGKSYHTFKEEFEIVHNYLAIQQERFKDEDYVYDLPVKEEIKLIGSHPIFLMQIQILVENAIEHGIRHRENGGYVSVKIINEKEQIKIVVLDNGIGRAAADSIGSAGTQQGLYMLKTIHQLYNQKNTQPIIMTYEDLPTIEEGQAVGTRVTVILPKEYNYEFGEV